jgi:hypothetical protein
MFEVPQKTLTIVEDGAEVGSLTLRAQSLEKPRNLPGFPGEQDGFALYLGINGFPVAGIVFPVVQEKVELSRSTYLVWPLKVEDRPTEDADIVAHGTFRADFSGMGTGFHNEFHADFSGEGMGAHSTLHARFFRHGTGFPKEFRGGFFGDGMGGLGWFRADFSNGTGEFSGSIYGKGVGGHCEFYASHRKGMGDHGNGHADFTSPAIELRIRSSRVNVGNITQLMLYCFKRLADQREGTHSVRLARVTYDPQVAALCSQPYLGSTSATESYLKRRADELPKSSFSLTFGDEVSAKDVASFLSFIHQRSVEKGGLGLSLLIKQGEAG